MAHTRAPLASHGLEDFAGLVAPTRDRESLLLPIERQEEADPSSVPTYAARDPKDRVVPYPVRLTMSQIERLETLKATRGIIPAELIRHAVGQELDRIELHRPTL